MWFRAVANWIFNCFVLSEFSTKGKKQSDLHANEDVLVADKLLHFNILINSPTYLFAWKKTNCDVWFKWKWLVWLRREISIGSIDPNCNDIDLIFSDKQLFKNAYEKVRKSILKNDEKSAKQIIAVLKKDQRHAINFAPDEEDTLLYLYVK